MCYAVSSTGSMRVQGLVDCFPIANVKSIGKDGKLLFTIDSVLFVICNDY